MTNPKIRIKKSFLLNDKVIPLLKAELEAAGREDEAREESIDAKVEAYRDAWSKYETKILSALCEALGVEFNQNIIDVYVAPFSNSFSDPMVISTKYSFDRAIEVLAHEISHRLLTDNTAMPMRDGRKLSEHWRELFGEHDFRVLTHIPVHALLQHIFIDILNEPYRLERDISFCSNHEPYRLAWEYVRKVGYAIVIEQLRESYKAK